MIMVFLCFCRWWLLLFWKVISSVFVILFGSISSVVMFW